MVLKAFHLPLIAGLLFCSLARTAPSPTSQKTPLVFVESAKATPIRDVLSYPARLIPKIHATMLSDIDGVVQTILAPLGQRVVRGQKIMVLKSTDPVYDYAPFSLTAQVPGIISAIEVTEGSRVTKGQRLGQITDPSKLKITIEVSVGDFSAIRTGLTGDLFVTGVPEKVAVRVLGVSPVVDPGTGSATAELAVVEKTKATMLPPGAIGKVSFQVREHSGIQIPESALGYKGPEPFVRVVEAGKAKFVKVQLGESRQGLVEVVKGISEGQSLIVRSNTFVAEGESVEVQTMEPKS